MGLDMYLEARKYVSGYSHRPIDEQNEYEEVLNSVGVSRADLTSEASPFANVSVNVAYWRKANQIHAWFILNYAKDGVDDCSPVFVGEIGRLRELRDLCQQVLDDHSKAEELLPVGEGFFFGSYDYNEYYFADLENTIEQIDTLLSNPKFAEGWEFIYQASW
jgi:hypothetical protein